MPVLNFASNFTNISILSSDVLAFDSSEYGKIEGTIQNFLNNLTSTTYVPMASALFDALKNLAVGDNSTLRILLAIDDGTVAFDSSKGVANNIFSKFDDNTINSSNHNTRPEILLAILGNTGVGISERFSKSVKTFQKYQANRIGSSTNANLGTFRISLNNTI